MNPVKIGAAALATAIATLALPAALQAGERPVLVEGVANLPKAYVSFKDLNLAQASDVGKLNARVRRAAQSLCFEDGFQHLSKTMNGIACRTGAIEGAQSQIELAIGNAGNARYAAATRIAVSLR